MRSPKISIFLLLSFFGSQVYAASVIQYQLDATLEDGGILTGTFALDLCVSPMDSSPQDAEFPIGVFDIALSNSPILSAGTGVVTELYLVQAASPGTHELHLLVLSDDMNSNAFGFLEFSGFAGRVEVLSPIEGAFSSGFLDGSGAPNFVGAQLSVVPEPAVSSLTLGSVFLLFVRRRTLWSGK